MERVIRLQAMDYTLEEIAVSTSMSSRAVTAMVHDPEYNAVRDAYVARMYEGVDKMIKRRSVEGILHNAAPDAADALVDLLAHEDAVERRLASTAILDRSGHGPVQRKAIRQRIELDPVLAEVMSKALKESFIDVDVNRPSD